MLTETSKAPRKREKVTYESSDVAEAAKRMLRALVKRAGAGDTEALRELADMTGFLSEAITDAGRAAYATGFYSYGELAGELGITRQAARQRFARRGHDETCEHNGRELKGSGEVVCTSCGAKAP